MTTEEPLLSELCRICNTALPRYRCPRCSLRTCSLPCSKRHKAWSQCSGVRDPTTYVKRQDLATPHAIDRDFNFLVGIERHLDGVERDIEERGLHRHLSGENNEPDNLSRRPLRKGEANLAAAIGRAGVIVEKAPKGLQRARLNQTHWNRRQKALFWTVEWITGPGKAELDQVLEITTLDTAWQQHVEGQERLAKKRKLSDMQSQQHRPISSLDQASITDMTSRAKRHFYLLRTHSSPSCTTLIPLPATATLASCLRGRLVTEFPAIYVLPGAPDELSGQYETEAQFLDRRDDKVAIVDQWSRTLRVQPIDGWLPPRPASWSDARYGEVTAISQEETSKSHSTDVAEKSAGQGIHSETSRLTPGPHSLVKAVQSSTTTSDLPQLATVDQNEG